MSAFPLLFRTHLYSANPSPFENNDLSETYWRRHAYPILEDLLSDIDGITMVDGEEQGFGSTMRKDKHRKVDSETLRVGNELGRKLDLIARDTINSRDWLVVESVPDWDESDLLLFKKLHMIATHRTEEASSSQFKDGARFFSLYSRGPGFKVYELRTCPQSKYVMLLHAYSSFVLPSKEKRWKAQIQGLVHLLQVRTCLTKTIMLYNQAIEDSVEEDD